MTYNIEIKMDNSILKCNHCHRIAKNGISDFYSLVENSNEIKKTCKKCRIETYKSYKKNNPSKLKNKIEKDYNEDYKNHKRCPQCKRTTTGENDYKHLKTEKIVKTCKLCRTSALEYYKKKQLTNTKKKTLKEQVEELKEFIKKNV